MSIDSLQKSLVDMTTAFATRFEQFENNLQNIKNTAAASNNNSNVNDVAGDFYAFRSFVIASLSTLHRQVELLQKISDQAEMRSRCKMLLVHELPEHSKEETSAAVVKNLTQHLKTPKLDVTSISRSHRVGKNKSDKPRPILVKFEDVDLKKSIWFSKTALKGSEITLSEFLTKSRHETFMTARRKFGVNKTWTSNGTIYILDSKGSKHSVNSVAELNAITTDTTHEQLRAGECGADQRQEAAGNTRPKRTNRNK
ncbi:unnamed protein product [Leptidea sinapis]|uniref:Uncharacterized protein n=1 Tax=Leptidea sinapis TaxID=189913 RepID=A0A5E4QNB8_9NEOP|nr:unnamed protein product [Leptidea sinapis]